MSTAGNVEHLAEVLATLADDVREAVAGAQGETVAEIVATYAETLAEIARYCLGALDEMSRGHFDAEGLAADEDYFACNGPHAAAEDALDALRQLTDEVAGE